MPNKSLVKIVYKDLKAGKINYSVYGKFTGFETYLASLVLCVLDGNQIGADESAVGFLRAYAAQDGLKHLEDYDSIGTIVDVRVFGQHLCRNFGCQVIASLIADPTDFDLVLSTAPFEAQSSILRAYFKSQRAAPYMAQASAQKISHRPLVVSKPDPSVSDAVVSTVEETDDSYTPAGRRGLEIRDNITSTFSKAYQAASAWAENFVKPEDAGDASRDDVAPRPITVITTPVLVDTQTGTAEPSTLDVSTGEEVKNGGAS